MSVPTTLAARLSTIIDDGEWHSIDALVTVLGNPPAADLLCAFCPAYMEVDAHRRAIKSHNREMYAESLASEDRREAEVRGITHLCTIHTLQSGATHTTKGSPA